MNNISQTDWNKVDSKSDEELTQNAINDPDNPPINEDFFVRAKQVQPPRTKQHIMDSLGCRLLLLDTIKDMAIGKNLPNLAIYKN